MPTKKSDSMSNQKTMLMLVFLVLLIGACAFLYWKQNAYSPTSYAPVTPTPVTTPSPMAGSAFHNGLTYSEALNSYKNRVQISGCHGTTGSSNIGTLSI